MKVYINGTAVRVELPLVDAGGAALEPESVSYRVLDAAGNEVIPSTPLAVDTDRPAVAKISIDPTLNQVAEGASRAMRVVQVFVTTASGLVRLADEYVIERDEILEVNRNSFQTYASAILTGMDLPNIPGWGRAAKTERVAAMIQARQNIASLRYRYYFANEQEFLSSSTRVRDLTQLSDSEWSSLRADFRGALARAQVLEADHLLGGDPIGDLRAAGIISKSTGESKAFFRANVRPIDGPICRRAAKELSKFTERRIRIGRVA